MLSELFLPFLGITAWLALTLFANSASAQSAQPDANIAPARLVKLFEASSPGEASGGEAPETLAITLLGPFSQIDKERDKSAEYQGQLIYQEADGSKIELDVKFQARGNWRLRSERCQFAQLWLDLKRRQVEGTLFEGQNRLKLAVQCGENSRSERYLLKEQLAYQIFAAFSPLHLETRLLNVTFQELEDPSEARTQLAFIIEHHNSVADENGMQRVKESQINPAKLDPLQTNLVGLFAYLLGSTDFSFFQGAESDSCCHNMKILEDEQGNYFPIPYDFDNTGLVDSEFAAGPSPNIGVRSNRQRVFRGLCMHTDQLPEAIAIAQGTQEQVMDAISYAPYLSDRNKRSARKFLGYFYTTLAKPEKVEKELINGCRYSRLES